MAYQTLKKNKKNVLFIYELDLPYVLLRDLWFITQALSADDHVQVAPRRSNTHAKVFISVFSLCENIS